MQKLCVQICVFTLGILVSLVFCGFATAAEPGQFRYAAPLEGAVQADTPVRVPLPPAVLAQTSTAFRDVRLFDDQGTEIPYVVYTASHPSAIRSWTILGYQQTRETQTIFLKRPDKPGRMTDLRLMTSNRDFEKTVEVYSSSDQQTWQKLTDGTFFDFSSHINVRKTSLPLPETNAPYLKVVLRDVTPQSGQDGNLRLRYKDLNFSVAERQEDGLSINGFSSRLVQEPFAPERQEDRVVISDPPSQLDQQRNTVLSLGRVNLPLERIHLRVPKGFFFRTVELWGADTDEDSAYVRLADDVMYRIPGINDEKTTLAFQRPQHLYVRLKIINHDNVPLKVSEVRIAWTRRDLYLIAEANRTYRLYCGGDDIASPSYDVKRLLPKNLEALLRFPVWTVGKLQANETYRSEPSTSLRELFERYGLILLVVVLACGLGVWVFHLMKKIPDGSP